MGPGPGLFEAEAGLVMAFGFGLGGFLERLVEGADGGGAFEACAFHELVDGAELEARILPGVGLVRVEAGAHGLGDPFAGGRLEGDEDTHGGLLAVENVAQVAHVFDAGLAALDLKDDRLGVGGAGSSRKRILPSMPAGSFGRLPGGGQANPKGVGGKFLRGQPVAWRHGLSVGGGLVNRAYY